MVHVTIAEKLKEKNIVARIVHFCYTAAKQLRTSTWIRKKYGMRMTAEEKIERNP